MRGNYRRGRNLGQEPNGVETPGRVAGGRTLGFDERVDGKPSSASVVWEKPRRRHSMAREHITRESTPTDYQAAYIW